MNLLRVKICGITRYDDALRACDLGTDAIGFIFCEKSPRRVTPEAAAAIAETLPAHVARTGVFVDAVPAAIARTVQTVGLNVVQFHGDYAPEHLAVVSGVRRVAVARVHGEFDVAAWATAHALADALLLDTYRAGQFGGTGAAFDWSLAQQAAAHGRVILAGGLGPENIVQAVHAAQPYAVDVNSGVESAPGRKDHKKLTELFTNLKEFRRGWSPTTPCPFPVA